MRVKLSDAFELQMGKTPDRRDSSCWNGTHKWVSIAVLSKADKYIIETKETISDIGVAKSGIKIVPKGTVIMSFKLSIGKTAITTEDLYTNEAIMAFIDKGIYEIDTNYIYHLFASKDWNEGTNKAVLGLTLNKATLSQVEIEIPSIAEQKQAVEVLDKVDELISLRKKQLQKLDDLVKSRFVEMFGDMADPSCKWPVCRLIEACDESDDIKCGPFGTQLSKDEYQESGIPVWEIPQINSVFAIAPEHFLTIEKAAQLQAYSLYAGDIVMSRKGNVGKCALFPSDKPYGILHSDVLRIRVSSKITNPCFMMCQLHFSRDIIRQIEMVSSGAIMAGVNVTKLKNIIVKMPPLELQDQFAVFVSKVDKSKLIIKQGLDKLEQMRQALMQKYFG